MKYLCASFLSAMLLLAAFGCQGNGRSGSQKVPVAAEASNVPPADLSEKSRLAIRLWERQLRVGDPSEVAARLFPERTLESNDLPTRFGSIYRARIWEKGTDGFGVILFEGRVAAALAHFGRASKDRVTEFIQWTEAEFPEIRPSFVAGSRTNYWFWEDANDRLMLCELTQKEGVQMTIALGNASVMDAIGASPEQAGKDAPRVDELLPPEKHEESPEG